MGHVVTALSYLLGAGVVAAALFGIVTVVFGRGEELPPLPPRATPTRLPAEPLAGRDVRALRFPQVVRGYRMDDVDWALERLAQELADAQLLRPVALLAAVDTRDEHDRHLGEEAPDLLRHVDAVDTRHGDVDHDRVGTEPLGEADRLVAVAGVADDVDVVRRIEERAESAAIRRVVVDEQDPVLQTNLLVAPTHLRVLQV